ncbi:MAG: Transcriptional regulatory protein ZraR [Planctomycetota bacterium]
MTDDATGTPSSPAPPSSSPPRADILVVDNDRNLRRLVAIRLEEAGHRAVMAESGAQALAEWNRRHFDLVISDIRMPNGDGLALAEAVQRARSVPIILMTGFRDRYEPRLALARDVVVIEKPFEAAALVSLVEALLHGRPLGRGDA